MEMTKEELEQAYSQLMQQAQQMNMELQNLRADRVAERFELMMRIMEHKTCYTDEVLKLAEWHIKQMLAKPKDAEE